MLGLPAIGFLFIAAVAVIPTLALRTYQRMTWWDYAYPFTGVIVWFPLGLSNVGASVTLSNLVVEVLWIAVLLVAVAWVRWIVSRFQKEGLKALSFYLTFLPIVVAVVIRLTMPTLPE